MSDVKRIFRIATKMVDDNGLINLSKQELCNNAGVPVGSFKSITGYSFTQFVKMLSESRVDENLKRKPVTKSRADPKLRKNDILNCAIDIAKSVGCHNIVRIDVAKKAGVSETLISRYFGTMPKFKRTIMRAAITRRIPEIVAKGLANNDVYARNAPKDLKKQAIATIK